MFCAALSASPHARARSSSGSCGASAASAANALARAYSSLIVSAAVSASPSSCSGSRGANAANALPRQYSSAGWLGGAERLAQQLLGQLRR